MTNELKRKTAMVLHQIEESLGRFVLKNGDVERLSLESLDKIHQRELDKGKIFNKGSIKDVVEATYLDELFRFALDIAQDSSVGDSLKYLYSLFHYLDIYEVRNAVSHPNRPFWDCYWYRVAAIASDPVNEILGLAGVKEALVSAERNLISDPPDEWIQKVIWEIPNNLPEQFDHGLTGLIGRNSELQELKRFIANPRVNTIALVAPGGAGKTALALDLLNNIVSTPSYSKFVDGVVYTTMKTEKLTANGVVPLDSIETVEELKETITTAVNEIFEEDYGDFTEVVSERNEDKVILCVDNLETLLRDNPQSFEELNHELPPAWKVIVTSRVSVSNATILSLENLKEKSAVHLARTYLSKRGGGALSASDYSRLTKDCFYNPLAIRLTIDLLLTGQDIPQSLNVANKEISEFSYNNLIEALSPDAVEILEAVFVEDQSTRLSLCELLGKNLDEISAAIGELSRTSLISRASSEQGETYSLSDSVRDLLVISPRNINVRKNVQERIHKRRVLSQEIDIRQAKKDIPDWHVDFIPASVGENLKILITEVNKNIKKARRNTDTAISLFRKLKEAKFIYEQEAIYHKALGRVLEILKDFNAAELHFQRAVEINPRDPSPTFLRARLLHFAGRYDEACKAYQSLIDDGWASDDPQVVSFGKNIYKGYFLSLLYSGRYKEVLEYTKDWKSAGVYRGLLGAYRAGAWKRKMENIVESDPNETVDALIRASRILLDVFRSEGYIKEANQQALSIFKEIEFCFSRANYCADYPNEGSELLKFISSNIVEISQSVREENIETLIEKLSAVKIGGNPFVDERWGLISRKATSELPDNVSGGLITVRVLNRPKDKASFLFARGSSGQDYFLHYDNFRDGNWKDWCQLAIGMSLHIVPDDPDTTSNKAPNAREIYMSV